MSKDGRNYRGLGKGPLHSKGKEMIQCVSDRTTMTHWKNDNVYIKT